MSNASIVERKMFLKVNVGDNNNKFYEVTLFADDQVSCRYGRVGENRPTEFYPGGRRKYDQVVNKRLRGGYEEIEVGATSTSGSRSAPSAVLADAAVKGIDKTGKNTDLHAMLRRFASANQHAIALASGGKITVSDTGQVTTALGPVTQATITEARTQLGNLAQAFSTATLSRYLTLIPQEVGRTRGWESKFEDAAEIARQFDFLDQLEGAIAMSNANDDIDGDGEPDVVFRYQLRQASPTSLARLRSKFDRTRNSMHTSNRLKLVNAWTVTDTEHDTWLAAREELGNVKRLVWHGTGEANLLSILHRGFYVPPKRGSTVKIAGRMFGDGVYFSDQSTKSLNYSAGFWQRGTSSSDRCFMFASDLVMGHEARPTASDSSYSITQRAHSHSGDKRYNSISVKGGQCGVRNNEIIVWDADQIGIRYLCEFA